MKRIVSFLLILLVIFCNMFYASANSKEQPPSLSAQAYVLFCADNNKVLLQKNAHTPMGMASTTKIMTALLCLEYAKDNDKTVEFTSQMTAEGSSMYLKAGDKLRLSDLAVGMMTVSGNDAANAAAIAIAGDTENFAKIMNNRAKEIGMKNTCFKNPSGLTEEGHYSTAYDMALLMTEAMKNDAFRDLTLKKNVKVDFIEPAGHSVTYNNHNRLLSMYEYCVGGKTGYTQASGRCLVTCSEKDNLRLVAVTLGDRNDWQDHIALYEYGYSVYKAFGVDCKDIYNIRVLGSDKDSIPAGVKDCVKYVAQSDDINKIKTQMYVVPFAFAPVKKGDVVGRVVCSIEDEIVLSEDILAKEDATYVTVSFVLRFLRSLFR